MKLKYPSNKYFEKSVVKEFIIGCESMRSVMATISQVAKYDINVLLLGESGTGKEILAKIIHMQSPRAENPFVAVNCGILSGLMFEDKLFGHEKGSFTGAIDKKKGCFELAHNGTLFLDEVSELPLENQVDLLRVLEEFKFMRIGGSQLIETDVRIISATNKDPKEEIQKGTFREDLFYRLQVVPIYLPPLRERRDVIPQMIVHFMDQFELTYKKPKPTVQPDAMEFFLRYDWPGNVRELKNLVKRIFILAEGDSITSKDLPSEFVWHVESPPETMELAQVRKTAETKAILSVLIRTKGNREKAARLLKISPRTLRHKLRQYNIRLDGSGERINR